MATGKRKSSKRSKASRKQPLVLNPFEAAKRKKINKNENDLASMPPPAPRKIPLARNHSNGFVSALSFESQTQNNNNNNNNILLNNNDSNSSQSWLQHQTIDYSQSIEDLTSFNNNNNNSNHIDFSQSAYLTPMDNNNNNNNVSSQFDILNNRIYNHTKSKIKNNDNKNRSFDDKKMEDNNNSKSLNNNNNFSTFSSTICRSDLSIPLQNQYLDASEQININKYKKEQKGIVLNCRYYRNYFEISLLGNGSFGRVYKCRNRDDGCLYAIKKIKINNIHNNSNYNNPSTMKEGCILSSLHRYGNLCSNIILYNCMWCENDYFYLVTEYCDHGNLYNYYKNNNQNTFNNNENKLFKILLDISNALLFLHNKNYIHFDVKPENILITKNFTFKLADFGLCIKLDNNNNIFKFTEGDSKYLCRELIENNYQISQLDKVDIFALGCSIYEIICGNDLPSNGFKWQQIRNNKLIFNNNSIYIQNIIRAMMHSNPNERPSAKQLTNLLRKFDDNDNLLKNKEKENQNLKQKIQILMQKIKNIQNMKQFQQYTKYSK